MKNPLLPCPAHLVPLLADTRRRGEIAYLLGVLLLLVLLALAGLAGPRPFPSSALRSAHVPATPYPGAGAWYWADTGE